MCPDTTQHSPTPILIPGIFTGAYLLISAITAVLLGNTAGLGFGALNEVVEFFVTLLVPESNVGGYVNTGWDLVANLVGATIAIALIFWLDRPRATRLIA